MSRDFRTGLGVGSILLLGGVLWLSTGTFLSPQQQLSVSHQRELQQQPTEPAPSEPLTSQQPSNRLPVNEKPQRQTAVSAVTTPPEPPPAEETSSATSTPASPSQVSTTPPRIHEVRPGETLSDIAAAYYGSAAQWRRIVAANPQLQDNPNRLRIGMRLVIPD